MGVKVREKVKGSGVWWVFISDKGERSFKQVGSEKAARKVADIIQARLKLGQDAVPKEKPAAPTLAEYYKTFKRVYMEPGLRHSTVHNLALAPLRILFSHAKENKLVQDNPAVRMGRHYRQAGKVHEEIQPLTADEVPEFLQAVMTLCPQHYCLFLARSILACDQARFQACSGAISISRESSSLSGEPSSSGESARLRRTVSGGLISPMTF